MAVASPPVFELPQRSLFDVVAANDVTTLLTLVRGDNPFDVSPGMELIREKRRKNAHKALAENAGVMANTEVRIDVGLIPRTHDDRGDGPAHVAAGYGLSAMLSVLVEECGCAVDEYNEQGLTPLHIAALHGHVDCVRLLCDLGAAPLSTTRSRASAASAAEEPFLRGRTTLFLAHHARQSAVLSYLLPSYTQLVRSTCEGQSAAQVWERAAAQQNTQLLSLLFDAVECADAPTGPLPLAFGFDVAAGLRAALPAVLAESLPADHRITREQLFLFDRLVRLGCVDAATPLSPTETVLGRILATAQVSAWRLLVEAGAVKPHRCDLAAVRSCAYGGDGEVELRLLITEAKAHAHYAAAKQRYLQKGGGEARVEAVRRKREAWKELQAKLQQRSIAPARAPVA